jgi:phosphoribosyl 1,2-cyclic phosphodiesterase
MTRNQIKVKFLGVRGSYNLSNATINKYGGNTSCVQIETADDVIFIDAGTGITKVDDLFETKRLHLLFTHYHWDHIIGLPFFSTLYTHPNQLMVKGFKPEHYSLSEALQLLFNPPFCPIGWQSVASRMVIEEVAMTGTFQIGDISIDHVPIMHPGGALGYRFNFKGISICLLTDIELSPEFKTYDTDFEHIRRFVADADVMVMDAAMTDDEYYGKEGSRKVGWGHSTINECIKLAEAANVKATYITHYLPYRKDGTNDALITLISKDYEGIYFAAEDSELIFEAH